MHKLNLKSLCLVGSMLIVTGGLASANLINNPGFETGSFTGWTTTPAASGSIFLSVPASHTPARTQPSLAPAARTSTPSVKLLLPRPASFTI